MSNVHIRLDKTFGLFTPSSFGTLQLDNEIFITGFPETSRVTFAP